MNIKKILNKHLKWLKDEEGGERANLYEANLSGANLDGANLYKANLVRANLSGANLDGANLDGANLVRANLSGANLDGANLYEANLYEANLYGANLSEANLSEANLRGANLSGANLSGANLVRANLYGANLDGASLIRANLYGANLYGASLEGVKNLKDIEPLLISCTSICPEGTIIGWKKCKDNVIVKLEIPAEAKRSNSTGRKCRAEYAKVIEVIGAEVGISQHDNKTEYKAGEIIRPDKWDDNRWKECSSGIHFFITRAEAERY